MYNSLSPKQSALLLGGTLLPIHVFIQELFTAARVSVMKHQARSCFKLVEGAHTLPPLLSQTLPS